MASQVHHLLMFAGNTCLVFNEFCQHVLRWCQQDENIYWLCITYACKLVFFPPQFALHWALRATVPCSSAIKRKGLLHVCTQGCFIIYPWFIVHSVLLLNQLIIFDHHPFLLFQLSKRLIACKAPHTGGDEYIFVTILGVKSLSPLRALLCASHSHISKSATVDDQLS